MARSGGGARHDQFLQSPPASGYQAAILATRRIRETQAATSPARIEGELYDKGRWTHALVPLEIGGRTLHIFNLYGYDESYEEHGELNRAILQEMLPHVFDWLLVSPHMRDSVSAERRLDLKPDHYAVQITLAGSWVKQTFLKRVTGAPPQHDNPVDHWRQAFDNQGWRYAMVAGNIDQAWQLWKVLELLPPPLECMSTTEAL
eukprot:315931-Amphidinium_carterae.1